MPNQQKITALDLIDTGYRVVCKKLNPINRYDMFDIGGKEYAC